MRRILGLTVALTLALTGTAAAHTDYRSVTLYGPTNTFVDGPTVRFLACWETAGVSAANKTVYVRNAANVIHYGFGDLSANWAHIHPADGDYVTGPETRAFFFWSGTSVATRRVTARTPYGWASAIKVVWTGGPASHVAIIRANC